MLVRRQDRTRLVPSTPILELSCAYLRLTPNVALIRRSERDREGQSVHWPPQQEDDTSPPYPVQNPRPTAIVAKDGVVMRSVQKESSNTDAPQSTLPGDLCVHVNRQVPDKPFYVERYSPRVPRRHHAYQILMAIWRCWAI